IAEGDCKLLINEALMGDPSRLYAPTVPAEKLVTKICAFAEPTAPHSVIAAKQRAVETSARFIGFFLQSRRWRRSGLGSTLGLGDCRGRAGRPIGRGLRGR